MSSEVDFDTELEAEVTNRLSMMEEPDYEFPTRMAKSDFIIVGIIMAFCLIAVEFATLTAGGM